MENKTSQPEMENKKESTWPKANQPLSARDRKPCNQLLMNLWPEAMRSAVGELVSGSHEVSCWVHVTGNGKQTKNTWPKTSKPFIRRDRKPCSQLLVNLWRLPDATCQTHAHFRYNLLAPEPERNTILKLAKEKTQKFHDKEKPKMFS